MVVCLFTSAGIKSVAKISHRQRKKVNRYRLRISQVAQKPGNTTSLRQIKIFLVKVSGLRKLSITRLANGVSVSKLIPIFKHRWLDEKRNHREFGSGARQPEISVVADGCGAQKKFVVVANSVRLGLRYRFQVLSLVTLLTVVFWSLGPSVFPQE